MARATLFLTSFQEKDLEKGFGSGCPKFGGSSSPSYFSLLFSQVNSLLSAPVGFSSWTAKPCWIGNPERVDTGRGIVPSILEQEGEYPRGWEGYT